MDISRRSFIKWVIAGAAASSPFGCAMKGSRDPRNPSIPDAKLLVESHAGCHDLRDGLLQSSPPASSSHDVIVIGAGAAGLAAAEHCFGSDFLLLEKEPNVGGNCWSQSWEGLDYCTGSAWLSLENERVKALFKRWGIDPPVIKGHDSAHFDGKWIQNFWSSDPDSPSYSQLPYSKSVQDDFRRFIRETARIDREKEAARLYLMPFSDLFAGYDPHIRAYWDNFGPSNWGGRTEDSSALIGLQGVHEWPGAERRTYEGGLGMITKQLFDSFPANQKNRCLLNTTVYRVAREQDRVLVSFLKDGKPQSVSAKACVMALPKFMARRMIADLPEDQRKAMASLRYAPYLVYNLCFDRVVWNLNYDNWAVGAKHFTDFIPADFVTHGNGGDLARKQIVTVYAPKTEAARADFLDNGDALREAHAAVSELMGMFPSWLDSLREVHVYNRGHAMPMSAPGSFTRLQATASRALPPIYFAHSDSSGPVSDMYEAAIQGVDAAQAALRHV